MRPHPPEPTPKPPAAGQAPAAGPAPTADPERAMRTCPNCGRELSERGCKLRCPDPACGYFLSCAEYY